jgi:hypothetical protein
MKTDMKSGLRHSEETCEGVVVLSRHSSAVGLADRRLGRLVVPFSRMRLLR